jgi:hypothetical protein
LESKKSPLEKYELVMPFYADTGKISIPSSYTIRPVIFCESFSFFHETKHGLFKSATAGSLWAQSAQRSEPMKPGFMKPPSQQRFQFHETVHETA